MRPHRPPKHVKLSRCPTGKIQHRTQNGATAHLLRLEHSRAADGQARVTYVCRRCGMWHIGRARPTSLTLPRPA